jgi:hypothetical protein
MSGATVEATLELWAAGLREAKERIRPLFAHPSVAASAAAFLDGLLGPERRKSGWMRAEGPRVIRVPGASRPCWGAAAGMRRRCATWCAIRPLRPWPHPMPCW